MTPFPWFDLAKLASLILLNGVFAMSELAIVSARPAQLRMAADKGSQGAAVALKLAADPGKFLSTVQIGITLIGIIAGAYSGAVLGGPMGERLAAWGLDPAYSANAGFVLVIAITTYFSLVIGELVPKQLALRGALPIAVIMSRPMAILAKIMAPFVWLLDSSSSLIMRIIGVRNRGEQGLSAEELQMIFADATRSGVLEEQEGAILSGIMRLADRPVRDLMTPRTEMDWIDRSTSEKDIFKVMQATPHSLLPVCNGEADKVLGVVRTRELLTLMVAGTAIDLGTLIRKAEVVPDQLDALDALRVLQKSGVGMAMVHDEYGHLDGIITPADLLAAIAGSFASHMDEGDEPEWTEQSDGSMLISGAMSADFLSETMGLELPETREFSSVAGYVLFVLKQLPKEGERFEEQGWSFEVVEMDGRRIDKVLASRVSEEPE